MYEPYLSQITGDLIELKQKRFEKTTSHRRLYSNRFVTKNGLKQTTWAKVILSILKS